MNRLTATGMMMLLGFLAAAPAYAEPDPKLVKATKDFVEAAQKQDCAGLIAPGRLMLELAPNAPADKRAMVFAGIASCELYLKRYEDAYRDVLAATAIPASIDQALLDRAQIEAHDQHYDALLTTLELMADGHPLALSKVDPDWLGIVHKKLDDAGNHEADMRLLKLLSTTYVPEDPFADVDAFRLIYASKLAAQGKEAEARAMVNAIVRIESLVGVALDKTLRGLRAAPIDFTAHATQQLLDDQSTLAAHPESLAGVATVAKDLNRLGKYQAALDVLESVRAHINDPAIFADQWRYVNWWWNRRADTYQLLGDFPHVAESYGAAIAAGERGTPNVSQLLNLAEAQIQFGHFEAALATLATAGDEKSRSAYGNMVFHETRGCAAFKTGKKDIAAQDVAFIRTHQKDGPGPAEDLLLCIGDMDRVAAILIHDLNDPDRRRVAVRALSFFKPEPANAPLWPGMEKWPRIQARADVKAALDQAGGPLTFPFRTGEL